MFGYVQRMGGSRIPKRVLHSNFGTRLRGGPRDRWQEKVHNIEEWKKLGITAFCTCQWNEMNVISRGLWPPFLADLYPCTEDETKENIQSVVLVVLPA